MPLSSHSGWRMYRALAAVALLLLSSALTDDEIKIVEGAEQ